MTQEIRPTGVQADRNERVVRISWSDGHTTVLSFDGMRLACPCVECKGGHANMGQATPRSLVRDAPTSNLQLTRLDLAGQYALQPAWSDGHTTGIYTWELLRAIDPAFIAEE